LPGSDIGTRVAIEHSGAVIVDGLSDQGSHSMRT
jgi:hypothetical protein